LFFTRKQLPEENFDKYLSILRNLVKTFFGEIEDNLLQTQVVLGVASKELQATLLRSDLPLEKTIKVCQAVEQTETNCKMLADDQSQDIDYMERQKGFNKKETWSRGKEQQEQQLQKQTVFHCNKCGRRHGIKECPAYGKVCMNCKKQNHFAAKM